VAQHDYSIANGSGAAVRSDLNNALAAIVSQNSGTTEPSPTYAYMPWADTTTGLYKIRNAANNAWVTVGTLADSNLGLLARSGGTMTGALLADDSGTAALPAIAFDGDPDTGAFIPGANQYGIATNGSERARIDSSGRFLVGTSSARNVGATVTYNALFENAGDTDTGIAIVQNRANADGASFILGKSRGTAAGGTTIVQSGDTIGTFSFAGADGTDLETNAASISAQVDGTPGTNDMPGRLVFSTTADGASSPTERFRISNDGSMSAVIPGGSTLYPASMCRAWVNFNGTGTPAIRGQYNVSSITDNGTGDFTVNFTTALTDANYSAVLSTEHDGGTGIYWILIAGDTAPTSSALRLDCFNTSQARSDPRFVSVAIFR
jgi:hypothetical protein